MPRGVAVILEGGVAVILEAGTKTTHKRWQNRKTEEPSFWKTSLHSFPRLSLLFSAFLLTEEEWIALLFKALEQVSCQCGRDAILTHAPFCSRGGQAFLWSHWFFLRSRQEVRRKVLKNWNTPKMKRAGGWGRKWSPDPRGMHAEAVGNFYSCDIV